MARVQGGGKSVTKKGLGEHGHEIFTSHTYTAPNMLSSGLPTCQCEPGAGTCPAGHGKNMLMACRAGGQGHTDVTPRLESGWLVVPACPHGAQQPPGSCQLLLTVLGRTSWADPRWRLGTIPPVSAPGWHAWGRGSPSITRPWAHGRPASRCPFPFLSPSRPVFKFE